MKKYPPCDWDIALHTTGFECQRCGMLIPLDQPTKGTPYEAILAAEKACKLREAIKRVRRPWTPGSQGTMED